MPELISVVVPVYNPGKYLKKCLESLAEQTYTDLEVLLIDDGSTDGSDVICKQFAEMDGRFRYYRQENAGVSAARNRGLEMVHGKYISFVDSDDYLEIDAYQTLVSVIEAQKTDIVCFEYFATYPDHEVVHSFADKFRYGRKDRKEAMKEQVSGVPFLWTKLFSASVLHGIRFTVGLARGEDGEFAHKAIHQAQSVYYLDRPLLHYVQAEQSATRGKFRPSQLTYLPAYANNDSFFAENYPELLQEVRASFIKTTIMLYCAMYSDREPYEKEMREAFGYFKITYKKLKKKGLGRKRRIKFRFFATAPKTFAWLHSRRFHIAG